MKQGIPGLMLLVACWSFTAQAQVIPAFPNLSFSSPVDIQAPPDGSNRLFVVEQGGTIRVFENDPSTTSSSVFLDISGDVSAGGERGLLGMAFHPNYASNGFFYVNYTAPSPLRTVIARYTASGNTASTGSEVVLLEVDQPFDNHNAGQLQFGPDGYLYVGLGDGGSGGDPNGHGQNTGTLLGSILRLDVDGGGNAPDCGVGGTYTVPADNPLADGPGDACDEIWAYGFRNPWRFSFGPGGTLWVGDVGQGAWEEINTVSAGGNYGWNIMEGAHCYPPGSSCDTSGLTLPVAEYPHDSATGGFSVTGGYVYTAASGGCSFLQGQYIYGDYVSGNIWTISPTSGDSLIVQNSGLNISTFGLDANSQLLIADRSEGVIYQFDCNVLPVELAAFEAQADGPDVLLRWTTASETNNAGFEIHHSKFAEANLEYTWDVLTFVDGHGTTLEAQTYSYRVEGLAPGVHRFRLKQIDYDGTFAYSPEVEVAVEVSGRYHLSAIYPNPFNPQARFTLAVPRAQPVRVEVVDLLGRRGALLHDGMLEANQPVPFVVDGAAWPSGVYVVRVQGEQFSATRRVVLAK